MEGINSKYEKRVQKIQTIYSESDEFMNSKLVSRKKNSIKNLSNLFVKPPKLSEQKAITNSSNLLLKRPLTLCSSSVKDRILVHNLEKWQKENAEEKIIFSQSNQLYRDTVSQKINDQIEKKLMHSIVNKNKKSEENIVTSNKFYNIIKTEQLKEEDIRQNSVIWNSMTLFSNYNEKEKIIILQNKYIKLEEKQNKRKLKIEEISKKIAELGLKIQEEKARKKLLDDCIKVDMLPYTYYKDDLANIKNFRSIGFERVNSFVK